MNKRQVKAIWGGVVLAVLAILFAPFNWPATSGTSILTGKATYEASTFAGYRWLFGAAGDMVQLNVTLLVVELMVVAGVTVAAVMAFRQPAN